MEALTRTTKWSLHRENLLAKVKDSAWLLRGREIAVESVPDPLDEVRQAADREVAIASADRETVLLADIRTALKRLGDGSYGCCEDCGDDIAPRGLSAVPWARRCLYCQDEVEKARSPSDGVK